MCYEIIMTCNLPVRSMLACIPMFCAPWFTKATQSYSYDIIERWNEWKRFVGNGESDDIYTLQQESTLCTRFNVFRHLFSFFYILTNKFIIIILYVYAWCNVVSSVFVGSSVLSFPSIIRYNAIKLKPNAINNKLKMANRMLEHWTLDIRYLLCVMWYVVCGMYVQSKSAILLIYFLFFSSLFAYLRWNDLRSILFHSYDIRTHILTENLSMLMLMTLFSNCPAIFDKCWMNRKIIK